MSDSAYANAVRRKAALEAELRRVNEFLEMYKRYSEDLTAQSSGPISLVDDSSHMAEQGEFAEKRAPDNYAAIADRYIREANRPLTRTELQERFRRDGIELPSSDGARYLGTILWRNRHRFVNIPGRGYWVENHVDQPLQPSDLSQQDRAALIDVARRRAQLDIRQAAYIIAEWDSRRMVPFDVDKYLLGTAKNTIGRELSPGDRNWIREEFIGHLREGLRNL